MAHVLLPCDLPSWPDVQKLLSQLRSCPDGRTMVRIMENIFDACCVSLDPDDAQRPPQVGPHPGLSELRYFVEDVLNHQERKRLLENTLPALACRAADLKRLKPPEGLLYSLRKNGGCMRLDRGFVLSLLANAFFSTFPKRNAKTHPTLQDFRMIDFFGHLSRRNHQKKLKFFLHYFENLVASDSMGHVTFTRKVVSGPSLPGWLCSDRPLVPLVLKPEGSVQDADNQVYRACFCMPLIGGDVLKASTSKESKLFFTFPELLVLLSFVESLEDDEALIADTPRHEESPAGFCFLDASLFDDARQFEDQALLRELNKALAAFLHEPQTEDLPARSFPVSTPRKPLLNKKSVSQTSSKMSMRTASQSSMPPPQDDYYTADDDSEEGSRLSDSLPHTEEASISRSDSLGFVLGDESGEDSSSLPHHERLDDFRKRIRKRTRRRLSRRSSSYAGTSGSSDMEDISEDPELMEGVPRGMRPANSEPSLASILYESSPLCEEMALRGSIRRLMVTASNGHLKAYSYDGVSPNLPVPFRARFRKRRSSYSPASSLEEAPRQAPVARRLPVVVDPGECFGDSQLKVTVLWLAASMADLQSLVLYTAGQPQLSEVSSVYRKVLSREWTVGDLSCEVLRFCRNRLYPKRRSHSRLFCQLIGRSPDSLDLD